MSAEQIKEILRRLNASISELHGGSVDYLDFEEGVLKVRLGGACVGCAMIDLTLNKGILNNVKKYVPTVKRVVAIEPVDEAVCLNCGNQIDQCRCVCPYCGEVGPCECCVGYGVATGG